MLLYPPYFWYWGLENDYPEEYRTQAFGTLIEDGFDWGRDAWTSPLFKEDVLEAVRPVLNEKIEDTFYFREINIADPDRWKRLFVQRINRLVSKQAPLYNELSTGVDLSGQTDRKKRLTHSEFPQAQLANLTEDYASSADQEGEVSWSSEDNLRVMSRWINSLDVPDNAVLDGLDDCFSHRAYFLDED